MESIPGKNSIHSLQKRAILGTSQIIWKVLHSETWSLWGEDHRWFKRSTRVQRPVTRDNNNNNSSSSNITIIIIPKPQKRWLLQWAAMANAKFSELHSPYDKPTVLCNLPVPTLILIHSLPWPSVPRILSGLPIIFYLIWKFTWISQCFLCIFIVRVYSILIVVYVFRPCILNVVYVFLLLCMYSYCSSMYSYCCLRILRRGYPDWGFSVLFRRL